LGVPTHKVSISAARGAVAPQQVSRRKADAILTRRDRLMAEITGLRRQAAESQFLENAQQLLTRWWSGANWNAREDLLKTAGWLVRLQKRREMGGCVEFEHSTGVSHGRSARSGTGPAVGVVDRLHPMAQR
jgi:hypothetical protein